MCKAKMSQMEQLKEGSKSKCLEAEIKAESAYSLDSISQLGFIYWTVCTYALLAAMLLYMSL